MTAESMTDTERAARIRLLGSQIVDHINALEAAGWNVSAVFSKEYAIQENTFTLKIHRQATL